MSFGHGKGDTQTNGIRSPEKGEGMGEDRLRLGRKSRVTLVEKEDLRKELGRTDLIYGDTRRKCHGGNGLRGNKRSHRLI